MRGGTRPLLQVNLSQEVSVLVDLGPLGLVGAGQGCMRPAVCGRPPGGPVTWFRPWGQERTWVCPLPGREAEEPLPTAHPLARPWAPTLVYLGRSIPRSAQGVEWLREPQRV